MGCSGLHLGVLPLPMRSGGPSGAPAWRGGTGSTPADAAQILARVEFASACSSWMGVRKLFPPGGLGTLGGSLQALWCRNRASTAATGASRPRPRARPRMAASSGPAGRQGLLGWGPPQDRVHHRRALVRQEGSSPHPPFWVEGRPYWGEARPTYPWEALWGAWRAPVRP